MMKQVELLQEGLERIRLLVKSGNYKDRHIYQGDHILKQNQNLDSVYWASVAQYGIYHTTKSGKTLSLGDYYSEDRFFGEVEFFSGRQCQFDVIANADLELVVIPVDQLTKILLQDGTIAYWLNHSMSKLYQDSMDVAIERSMYPLKYNILKDIVLRYTSKTSYTHHVFMYQEAQRFGCTERAYNRIIQELLGSNLIVKEHAKNTYIPRDVESARDFLNAYNE